MRVLLLACMLLLPAASASVHVCSDVACADAWSEDAGSCSAGGSERNVVSANLSEASTTRAWVETYCLQTERGEYREVRLVLQPDPLVDATQTHVLWSFDSRSGCALDVERSAPGGEAELTRLGCPRGTPPPRVPPLFP